MSDGQVSLVGDLMIRTPGLIARYEGDEAFRAMLCELGGSEVVVANLEIPLSRRGYEVPKTINLRADPLVINDVQALGVNVVTLANNHMMDFGPDAMFDTVAACDRAGIDHCGAGGDLDSAMCPAWFQVAGSKVALLSLACTLPVESDAAPGKPGIAPLRVKFSFEADVNLLAEQPGSMPWVHSWAVPTDVERICQSIVGCRDQGASAVIVAIHWGSPSHWLSPYQGLLAAYQQPLAHALIDAGADVICGHHSHHLHPIEVYQGKPIFYSLGNFVFEEPYPMMEPESVIVRLRIGDQLACELVPLILDEVGVARHAIGDQARSVFARLTDLSTPFGARILVQDDLARVKLA